MGGGEPACSNSNKMHGLGLPRHARARVVLLGDIRISGISVWGIVDIIINQSRNPSVPDFLPIMTSQMHKSFDA